VPPSDELITRANLWRGTRFWLGFCASLARRSRATRGSLACHRLRDRPLRAAHPDGRCARAQRRARLGRPRRRADSARSQRRRRAHARQTRRGLGARLLSLGRRALRLAARALGELGQTHALNRRTLRNQDAALSRTKLRNYACNANERADTFRRRLGQTLARQ
jgi:hypothetical protein